MHDDKTGATVEGGATAPERNARAADERALSAGSRVEKFEIVDLIGAGRAGFVYLAYDHGSGAHVALREYMPRDIASRGADGSVRPGLPQNTNLFGAGLKSFASEALVLARIDSPSLVKVFRYWEGNGSGYSAMPFYDGSTLKQVVGTHRGTINEVRLRNLLEQLLHAVEAVHRAQSCHGGISPSDILIRADGRPLLLEFDAAKSVLAEMMHTQYQILKPGFAALEQYPEQRKLEPGAWSDVYALGAVAYFLIAGKAPPPAPQRSVQDMMLPAREAGRGSYSQALLEAIDRALAVQPDQRIQSAAELRALLGTPVRPEGGFTLRASHAMDAIRADREAAAQAQAHPAASASTPAAPHSPAMDPRPAATSDAEAAAFIAQAATPTVIASMAARPPLSHIDQPLQHEWRKQPVIGDTRDYAPRRKRSRAALGVAALMLFAGVSAGVLFGYQTLNAPSDDAAAQSVDASSDSGQPAGRIAAAPDTTAAMPPKPSEKAGARAPASPAPAVPPVAAAPLAAAPAPAKPLPAPPQPAEKAAPRGDAAEQEEWKIASTVGEEWSYENYLKRFPEGPNAADARRRLGSLREAAALRSAGKPSAAGAPAAAAAAPAEPRAAQKAPEVAAAPQMADAPPAKGEARTIQVEGQTFSGDYEGEVRNGLPNGRGVLVFAKGDRYDGEIRNGVPNGKGALVFADGTRYEGELRDGMPHGQGTTRFRNGDVYTGSVAKGRSHGQGRLSWANGSAWEGEFRDGLRTANGRTVSDAGSAAVSGASGETDTGAGAPE